MHFATGIVKVLSDLLDEITSKNKPSELNASQITFKLAQALSKLVHTPPVGMPGEVFISRLFDPRQLGHANISITELTSLLGLLAAHEIGHRIALPHTSSFPIPASATPEVQFFGIAPGAPSFSLSYAGSSTPTIPLTASASNIQAALAALPGLIDSQLQVFGPNNGFYTVIFARGSYSGIDIPQITGVNITLGQGTNGNAVSLPAEKIILSSSGVSGFDDLMRPTTTADPVIFLPSISGVLLDLALTETWGSFQINRLQGLLVQYAYVGGLAAVKPSTSVSPSPNSPTATVSDLNDFVYAGPGLMLLDSDGRLADEQQLDFEIVDPNAPATKTLKLVNFGGQPVVVRSIGVTQGYDRFSVPTMPVTTLQPGESLQIPVTFNSVLNLGSSGLLVVDSDIGVMGGTVDLVGTGQLTNQPQIRLDFYNNLQEVRVGERTSFAAPGSNRNPILTNIGSAPLTITEIRVAAGQGFGEWVVPPLTRAHYAGTGRIDRHWLQLPRQQDRPAARHLGSAEQRSSYAITSGAGCRHGSHYE